MRRDGEMERMEKKLNKRRGRIVMCVPVDIEELVLLTTAAGDPVVRPWLIS